MRPPVPLLKSAVAALLFAALIAPVQARRLALVIGNDNYQNVQPLKNARADAKAIAAELKTMGFDVTLKQDLSQKMMKSALREFKALVQGGDEVVFYFSGHGVQFGGSNYLIPIDITADSAAQVADDAIPLQRRPINPAIVSRPITTSLDFAPMLGGSDLLSDVLLHRYTDCR